MPIFLIAQSPSLHGTFMDDDKQHRSQQEQQKQDPQRLTMNNTYPNTHPNVSSFDDTNDLLLDRGVIHREHFQFFQQPPQQTASSYGTLVRDFEWNVADVLCGRSKLAFNHDGNHSFRDIITRTVPLYAAATSNRKRNDLVSEVVLEVRKKGGRFLKKHPSLPGTWYELTEKDRRGKVAHALRDAVSLMEDKKNGIKRIKRKSSSSPTKVDNESSHKSSMYYLSDSQSQSGSSSIRASPAPADVPSMTHSLFNTQAAMHSSLGLVSGGALLPNLRMDRYNEPNPIAPRYGPATWQPHYAQSTLAGEQPLNTNPHQTMAGPTSDMAMTASRPTMPQNTAIPTTSVATNNSNNKTEADEDDISVLSSDEFLAKIESVLGPLATTPDDSLARFLDDDDDEQARS